MSTGVVATQRRTEARSLSLSSTPTEKRSRRPPIRVSLGQYGALHHLLLVVVDPPRAAPEGIKRWRAQDAASDQTDRRTERPTMSSRIAPSVATMRLGTTPKSVPM